MAEGFLVCPECGTDQVAKLDWQEPYRADGEAYPSHYCAACEGPVAARPPQEDEHDR
jgi:hypothetical protein